MECEHCKNETDILYWNPSYPLLITKGQQWRGVTTSGDILFILDTLQVNIERM